MNYLTFVEYVSVGGVCDETTFVRNIDRACSAIDNATFNRIQAMAEIPQKVKSCCRDLVEYYANNVDVSKKTIASTTQSAGPVSESVSYTNITVDDVRNNISDILFDYLSQLTDDNGTPLLYLGAML